MIFDGRHPLLQCVNHALNASEPLRDGEWPSRCGDGHDFSGNTTTRRNNALVKYATKAAADIGTDGTPNPHLRQLKKLVGKVALRAGFAGLTGPEDPYKGWGRWADMLGFRGHFASKSRRYSTTLGRLRQARRDHVRARLNKLHGQEPVQVGDDAYLAELQEHTTLVVGSWRFAGIGWLTAGDAALAAASAARARDD